MTFPLAPCFFVAARTIGLVTAVESDPVKIAGIANQHKLGNTAGLPHRRNNIWVALAGPALYRL
jgi:hypothetical protein